MKSSIRSGMLVLTAFGIAATSAPRLLAQHDHGGGGGMSMPMPSMPTVHTGKAKGKVVSKEQSSLTVETAKGQATYMMNGGTKTKGDLVPGAKVTVKYREEHGVLTATSVEAKKRKGA